MNQNDNLSKSSDGYDNEMNNAEQSKLEEIKNLVQNERYTEADILLDSLDKKEAEWYYLKGKVCYGKGWMDNAYSNYCKAAQMDSDNTEYAYERNRMADIRKEHLDSMLYASAKNKKKFLNKDDCWECCCNIEWWDCFCDIF